MRNKGRAQRHLLTAAGDVRLSRLYLVCPRCGNSRHPLDPRLGVCGFVSPQARKLLSRAGASWSFARAAEHLLEFCGLRTCDQTVRKVCFEEAGRLADWLHKDPAAGAAFAAADGDVELSTDGTMVNTPQGWREMRLGVFAKRRRGRPATAEEWDRRRRPKPHAVVLFAAIEAAEQFGPRFRAWAGRLGIRDPTQVTVLADGAEWIGKRARAALLGEGGAALQRQIAAAHGRARAKGKRKALEERAGYFAKQEGHLGYAARLAAGQSIGSGLVEGACKQGIGKRMKQTGARWRVRRANRMATLGCAFHGDTWATYWRHRLP